MGHEEEKGPERSFLGTEAWGCTTTPLLSFKLWTATKREKERLVCESKKKGLVFSYWVRKKVTFFRSLEDFFFLLETTSFSKSESGKS